MNASPPPHSREATGEMRGCTRNSRIFCGATYVPASGGTSNEAINIFIDVNKIAYDLYNNGWCNNVGFRYSGTLDNATPAIRKLSRNIRTYEKLHKQQESAKSELEEAQSNLDDAMEKLAELCEKPFRSCCNDKEYGVEGVPFTYLDLEYAMNEAIRRCIGAALLDDAKLYPNIDLDEYLSDDEEGGHSDKDSDEDEDDDDDEEDEDDEEDDEEDEDDE
jgi:hypothetical protein